MLRPENVALLREGANRSFVNLCSGVFLCCRPRCRQGDIPSVSSVLKDHKPFPGVLYAFICFIDLIYCGRKLRDDQTLDFYGIQSGSTVHVLRKSWPEPDQKPGGEEVLQVTLGVRDCCSL